MMGHSKDRQELNCRCAAEQIKTALLARSVVKNIDISISIDTEISERYQY